MQRRNRILLALFLVAVAALSVWAMRPRPIVVEVVEVSRGVFEQTVSDDGRTRVRDRYVVAAPLAGRVERSRLRVGDVVKRGETVAVLTPTVPAFIDARTQRELQARVAGAEAQRMRALAEMERTRAQLEHARNELSRAEKLASQGFVSETALEDARLALRTAEKAMDAARFAEQAARYDVEQARAALVRYQAEGRANVAGAARWEVRSPVNGAVLRVVQESEGVVAIGAPLVEIADPRSLEIIVDVLSQDAVNIRPGMPARVDVGASAPLGARVRRVEPGAFTKVSALGVEEQRVNVVLDFTEDLDRIETIGDGFRVDATIVVHRVEDAIKVPVGALFREGDGWAVFVAAGGRAEKRAVSVARRNGAEAQITEGLAPGERVVVYPPDSLSDGARIEAKGGGSG